ncbi:MAG: T9SS type A sorting domain-containing protein, partial [Victivallales bacterium]|nr:T9SS type A sorting domain-containing protein [Victivallales bacterium]
CFGAVSASDHVNAEFYDCDLHVRTTAWGFNVTETSEVYAENCLISKDSGGDGARIFDGSELKMRYCSIRDFTDIGVNCDDGNVDLGTEVDYGHNCIWSSSSRAKRLCLNADSCEFTVHGNWIDTVIMFGSFYNEIDTGDFFPPDSCDTTVAKVIADLEKNGRTLPLSFELGAAVPNPFNSTVSFEYTIPYDCEIEIAVFDLLGKSVCVLFDGDQTQGTHRIFWKGQDNNGYILPSGTYLYRLKAEDYEETKKMTLIK